MKLIYKGNFKGLDQLPTGTLPDNAVKFKEPKTMAGLNALSMVFSLPAISFILTFISFSVLIYGGIRYNANTLESTLGMIMAFVCIFPHELIHAICFGKDAEVELYTSPRHMTIFVTSTKAISKTRFVILSLLPSIIFGAIPLMMWAFLPAPIEVLSFLFPFSVVSILFGIGDYLNVYNALWQMPKHSYHQMSGFNSYWFIPNNPDESPS